MTIEELERVAAEFRFVGGLAMWHAQVRVARTADVVLLWCEIEIPDSTREGHITTMPLRTSAGLSVETLAKDQRSPEHFIVDHFREFVLHEFYESILVRGERLFDPHDAAKYHPGAL